MSRPSWFQRIYWTHIAKPAQDRALFAFLISNPVDSILELNIGTGDRTKRVARLAQSASEETIRFVGTDEFESSQERPHIPLKQAHQVIGRLPYRSSLIPGDIASALPRVAHKFGTFDLIILNDGIEGSIEASPLGTWLDRMAHEDTVLFYPKEPNGALQRIDCRCLQPAVAKAA